LEPETKYDFRAKAVGHQAVTASAEDFTTLALKPPKIETLAATDKTKTTAKLKGDLKDTGTAEKADISFQYKKSSDSDFTEILVQLGATAGPFEKEITGLDPGTEYTFKAKAEGDGEGFGDGTKFDTEALTPPTLITHAASDLTKTSAKLNGELTDLGSATSADTSFEYKKSSDSEFTEVQVQSGATKGIFEKSIDGLDPGTEYIYKAKAVGDVEGFGGDTKFDTVALTPPTITINDASEITANSAKVSGNLTDLGTAESADISIEYKKSSEESYTEIKIKTGTEKGTFSHNLTGLDPDSEYNFKAKAVGDGDAYSSEKSFTTLSDKIPPEVITDGSSKIKSTSAKLDAHVVDLGSAETVKTSFMWGTTSGDLKNETTAQDTNEAIPFSEEITGLEKGTTYYFQAKVVGDDTALGEEQSFTTKAK
jgi:hypothetical protein